MLDSPYVRRVAISLQRLGLPFTHEPLSVFRTFEQFARVNPVVKAPTLVCDDGTVLMDSTLILDYAETLAGRKRSLMPAEPAARLRALRVIGLALAACEKSVQMVYEVHQRPPERRHEPWLARAAGQLRAAYGLLEAEIARHPLAAGDAIDQAGITAAVAWRFTQEMVAAAVPAADHPRLQAFSAQAEALAPFRAADYGPGRYVGQDRPAAV